MQLLSGDSRTFKRFDDARFAGARLSFAWPVRGRLSFYETIGQTVNGENYIDANSSTLGMIAAAALSAAGFLGFFAMVVSCLPRDTRHYATIAPPLGGAANRLRRRCPIPELTQRILQARFVRFLARTGKSPYAGFVIRQYVLFKVLFQKRSFGLAMGDWC